ncbi:hypothetical protein RND81_12G236300 [Saponaria officinalis]|uniref:Mannosyltransferase n=1 Tax=Saponaria officinalis TaxID=3572 RepID=A0AAW1HEG0_SAPOF
METTTRHRRRQPSDDPPSTAAPPSSQYSKLYKPSNNGGGENGGAFEGKAQLGMILIVLGFFRYMSVNSNIIHDCDETFNYWEPLHYLLYNSGFQTWEYSSQYALRSYLYIVFHALVGLPASWLFGDDKVRVFYAVRFFLGLLSVVADAFLVVALSRRYGKRLASYTLMMLCLTSGCYLASTSFLPSTFSMYAMSLATALALMERPAWAVSIAASGVIIGWPFSVLAFLPVTLFSLHRSFKRSFLSGSIISVTLLVLSVLVDNYYYKRWTSSVLNLLLYNVLGGGESHLYGVEGPLFYVHNAFINFNFSFLLALLFPATLLVQAVRRKYVPELMIFLSPIYVWIGFMSLQPHKEERFLYPIYPLICVAASTFIDSLPDLFRDKYVPNDRSFIVLAAKFVRPVFLSLVIAISYSRTFSLIHGYSAPLEIYKHLDYHDDAGPGSTLCVGSEWHRFPSSFFIPDYVAQVRWIDDGFRGLLPLPFNSTLGGTSAAPTYFNNKNKASEEQYLRDLESCTLLVELHLKRPFVYRGSNLSTWEVVAALPFLDRELSPPLHRSFYIPFYWEYNNVFGLYKLLRRIPK